jgi:hypothetical protein
MNTIRDHAEEIRQFGYTIFRSFLPVGKTQKLRKLAEQRRVSGEIYTLGEDIFDVAPEVALAVVASPEVIDVMEAIVGPSVQLDNFSIVGVAGDCGAMISWHRDPYGSVPRGLEFQKPLCFNFLIYLQDLCTNTGPLRVIPGSHREPFTMSEDERGKPHDREVLNYLQAGDAVLLHNNLVHSRSPNLSGVDRIHVSVLYNLSCMRQHLNVSPGIARIRDKLAQMPGTRLRRLFGEDPYFWARNNSGFMSSDEEAWTIWISEEEGTKSPEQ